MPERENDKCNLKLPNKFFSSHAVPRLTKLKTDMLDFGKFCYLHVEKTGGTYVSQILQDASLLPLWRSKLHDTVAETLSVGHVLDQLKNTKRPDRVKGGLFRKNCFYFNSVREPFNYYASLYNYGCDGRGGAAYALRQHGKGHLYDGTERGFLNWVDFVLDGNSAQIWHDEYSQTCAHGVGFLTYRFLRLSVSNPRIKLSSIKSSADALSLYQKHNICNYTLKTETLNQDLCYLFTGPLKTYVNSTISAHLLDAKDRLNASVSRAVNAEILRNSSIASKVLERDSFIFKTFYAS